MRIISGKYKGRKLNGFDIDGTRPTMDRVKESIFGSIQNHVKGAKVLDLFAGSGSLGIEAVSNGASKCILVDNNNTAIKIIKENIKNMDDDIIVLKKDYINFLNETDEMFDIIFLDPPYKLELINKALKIIKEKNLLKDNGIIICEYEDEKITNYFNVIRKKRYGTTNVIIMNMTKEQNLKK